MTEKADQQLTPVSVESSRGSKESIIENFQAKRLQLWEVMLKKMKENPQVSRVLSAGVNATVGSYIKLTAEAYAGKTVDQQNLTPLGRIVHAFIVTTGLASYGLLAAGRGELAAISYGSSWAAYAMMYGPELLSPTLRGAADKLDKKHVKIASVLRAVATISEKPKKLFFKM